MSSSVCLCVVFCLLESAVLSSGCPTAFRLLRSLSPMVCMLLCPASALGTPWRSPGSVSFLRFPFLLVFIILGFPFSRLLRGREYLESILSRSPRGVYYYYHYIYCYCYLFFLRLFRVLLLFQTGDFQVWLLFSTFRC